MKEVMAAVFCILLDAPSLQAAEDFVFVRGRGLVDIDPFACTDTCAPVEIAKAHRCKSCPLLLVAA